MAAADIAALYRHDLAVDLAAAGCTATAAEYVMWQCRDCRLKQFTPDWVGGAGLYGALQKHRWYYVAEKPEFVAAAQQVQRPQRVLEVGCGSGHFQRWLPDGVQYVGLDTNPRAAAQAQAAGIDVRTQGLDEFAPGHRGQFDMACAFQVLEHVPQPADFMAALASTVKSGGLLVVSVPGDDSFVGREINNVLNMPPHHCTRWPDATLARLGELSGLHTIDVVHEALAPDHVRALALSHAWRGLVRLTRLPSQRLLVAAHSRLLRRAVALASLPARALLRRSAAQPRGHTTTVVLRKP